MHDEEERQEAPPLHDEDDKFVLRHESATPASQTSWFWGVAPTTDVLEARRSRDALTSDP